MCFACLQEWFVGGWDVPEDRGGAAGAGGIKLSIVAKEPTILALHLIYCLFL